MRQLDAQFKLSSFFVFFFSFQSCLLSDSGRLHVMGSAAFNSEGEGEAVGPIPPIFSLLCWFQSVNEEKITFNSSNMELQKLKFFKI